MVIQKNAEFFKDANTPAESKTFANSTADVLTVQVSGEFTDGLFFIEGRNNKGGDWCPLAAIDLSSFMPVRAGFSKPGLYELGMVGVREVRARIEKVSGQVSIFGQLISTEET